MNDHPSGFKTSRRPFLRFPTGVRLASLLPVFLALQCAPLQADMADDEARFNAASASQAAIPWRSGGVGDEAREEMRKAAASYNVHLTFIDRQGAYLSGIPVSVRRRSGQEIYSGVSEGPLLYLKLPRGSYQVSAMIDDAWQNRRIQLGAAGGSARLSFVAAAK